VRFEDDKITADDIIRPVMDKPVTMVERAIVEGGREVVASSGTGITRWWIRVPALRYNGNLIKSRSISVRSSNSAEEPIR
jgi:hypothetical protein